MDTLIRSTVRQIRSDIRTKKIMETKDRRPCQSVRKNYKARARDNEVETFNGRTIKR